MRANPQGGWNRAEQHESRWAEIFSEGETDPGSKCCQSASEQLKIDNSQLWEQMHKLLELPANARVARVGEIEKLKEQIRENSRKIYDQEGDPPLPSRQARSREFKAKKEGGLEVVEAKGKKGKGGKAGQQRAPR